MANEPDQVNPAEIDEKAPEQTRPKVQKLSAHYALPLSGFETIIKIIKGYAIASNGGASPVNYKDVASATGLAPSVVSRNNTFLVESQIITSPKYGYYVSSELATKFAREAAWDEANSKRHLRAAIVNTWYGSVVSQNFMTRSTLTRDDLKRVLAIKSGATEGDAESLGRLIDLLSYLGTISEGENGTFTRQAVPDSQIPESSQPVDQSLGPVEITGGSKVAATLSRNTSPVASGITVPQIQINLNIDIASIKELTDEDAEKIRRWVQLILKVQEEPKSGAQNESDLKSN